MKAVIYINYIICGLTAVGLLFVANDGELNTFAILCMAYPAMNAWFSYKVYQMLKKD